MKKWQRIGKYRLSPKQWTHSNKQRFNYSTYIHMEYRFGKLRTRQFWKITYLLCTTIFTPHIQKLLKHALGAHCRTWGEKNSQWPTHIFHLFSGDLAVFFLPFLCLRLSTDVLNAPCSFKFRLQNFRWLSWCCRSTWLPIFFMCNW